MSLNTNQQIIEIIKKSSQILLTFKREFSADSLAAALAWQRVLQKMDKKAEIVCDSFRPPKALSFLPLALIGNQLTDLRQFIISLNTSRTKVNELSYDNKDDSLQIFITPQNGSFKAEDVTTTSSAYKYDLVICLDTPDLESLGKLYHQEPDFFYHTPIINLDHLATNENFGQINIVDLTATATSEVVFNLLTELDLKLIDEDVATYLLLGIITATKNFKTPNVTPKCLQAASQLIGLGARREQIVQNLYQSRYLNTLKLWGRILVRLKSEAQEKLAWSILSRNDFLETSTAEDDLADVIDELIVNLPKVEIIALVYETAQNEILANVYSIKNISALELTKKFNPTGNRNLARLQLPYSDLVNAEKELIAELKNQLEKIGQ